MRIVNSKNMLQFLPAELEKQFHGRHESDLEKWLPLAGPAFGFLVIALVVQDFLANPAHAPLALLLRAACVGMAAIAFRRTALRWSATQRAGYIYWMYASAIILPALLLESGVQYGMTAIAASAFAVSLITVRFTTFFWIAGLPFLLLAVLARHDVAPAAYANRLMSYTFAVGLACLLMVIFRFLRQKAFLLELQLARVSRYDSLTGLYNRRFVTELASQEIMRAQRHGRPFAIIMLDIDHLKEVNDKFGHQAGDLAIKSFADACRAHLREIDVLGRIGGEEFVCLLPEASENDALACAERLRGGIEELAIDTPKGQVRLTVSIGVAIMGAEHLHWESLLRTADAALHQAKCEGRNRVVTAMPRRGWTVVGKDAGAA